MGTRAAKDGRMRVDFLIDLYGASVVSCGDSAMAISNTADRDYVVIHHSHSNELSVDFFAHHRLITTATWQSNRDTKRCSVCSAFFWLFKRYKGDLSEL
jgi:hypothetical protein